MTKNCLLTNIHNVIVEIKPNFKASSVYGDYEYYHYLCDGIDDRGWGCGYRTLQTLCSWLTHNVKEDVKVPSIYKIQETLVELQDKEQEFLGSKQWIGSIEVCLVIDQLYNIPSKIVHVNKGESLNVITEKLHDHFQKMGSPIMMGGDIDCSSKGIMGICTQGKETSLLVVDPHFVGKDASPELLKNKGWVKWQPLNDFLSSSFYNLCLPQTKKIHK